MNGGVRGTRSRIISSIIICWRPALVLFYNQILPSTDLWFLGGDLAPSAPGHKRFSPRKNRSHENRKQECFCPKNLGSAYTSKFGMVTSTPQTSRTTHAHAHGRIHMHVSPSAYQSVQVLANALAMHTSPKPNKSTVWLMLDCDIVHCSAHNLFQNKWPRRGQLYDCHYCYYHHHQYYYYCDCY